MQGSSKLRCGCCIPEGGGAPKAELEEEQSAVVPSKKKKKKVSLSSAARQPGSHSVSLSVGQCIVESEQHSAEVVGRLIPEGGGGEVVFQTFGIV